MESSAGIATALSPYIGYKKSAEIAKQSVREDRSVREIVLSEGIMTESELEGILDPWLLTGMKDPKAVRKAV